MKRKSKYQRKNKKSRDCTKCKRFGGYIGKNYFICIAEMFADQDEPAYHDIYDRDVLKKGTCSLFMPIEVNLDDSVHVNDAMERMQQENAADLLHEE